jgi:hypothetical protein
VSYRTSWLRPRSGNALLFFVALAFSTIRPHAQSNPQLAWDEDPASTVTGFAVIIDGVRTDYGLAPQSSDGTCNCSVPLPFSSGRHTIVVSAYNSDGEAASDPLTVGPTAQAGGPYSGQPTMPVSVTAAGSTDVTGTITSYVWNWGDGTQDDTSANDTASHIYQSTGIFTITLTVTDDFAASDTDTTTAAIVVPLPPDVPSNPNPSNGAIAIGLSPTLAWSAGAPGTSYDVFFGLTNPPPQVSTAQAAALYTPAPLADTTPYFWQIVAHNAAGATSGPIWSFTTMRAAAIAVPGTFQAEDFDEGGELVAYHDTTPGNSLGQYRSTDVDIEVTTDTGGGFDVGKVKVGEWLKYTVNVAATGTYQLESRVAALGAGATFHVEVDGVDKSGPVAVPDTGGWQSWQTVTTPAISLTAGTHVIRVAFDTVSASGGANYNWFRFTASTSTPPSTTPYGGTPAAVPGTVQAENFDVGAEGLAYHDATTGNSGAAYRSTDVDIQPTTDIDGGYNVGWTKAGEWLNYTVNVGATGTYQLDSRVANTSAGAAFHVEVDGVDKSGPIAVPNTGGWQTWQTVTTAGISLTAGTYVIRVVFDTIASSGGVGNYNWFQLTATSVSPPPPPPPPPSPAFGGTPVSLPGIVQAENFDNGGEGLAYHDTTAGNNGGVYRNTDVDLSPTDDPSSGGYCVAWGREGEWLKYSVNATEARTYALHVRVANVGSGAKFGIEVDGVDATGPVSVPETGGWDVWQTISLSGITLSQGPHVIRLVMLTCNGQNSGVGNFGYFLFE